MTATYQNNGDGTSTLIFAYTVDTQRILDTAEDAARYLHASGYGDQEIAFDDLTAKQRLEILDKYVKQVLIDAARTYHVNAAVETARIAALADDKYVTAAASVVVR